jgi:hypothetical protein
VHGLPQALAEDRVGLADPGQGAADGLADGHAGTLPLIGKGADPAAEPRRAAQLGDEPVSLGPQGLFVSRLPRPIKLGVQLPEAVPVLGDRRLVQHRMGRPGGAERGQPGGATVDPWLSASVITLGQGLSSQRP